MAESARQDVWLVCIDCDSKNYRTDRNLKAQYNKPKDTPRRNIGTTGGLQLRKYCKKCKKHAMHIESRKK